MTSRKRAVPSVRLVVDTNILRGASSTIVAEPPGATLRAVLQAILRICHRAVVSPALAREYNKHASDYGTRWLSAMRTKGKVVEAEATPTSRSRRWQANASRKGSRPGEELQKDLHLVLAAMETDQIVVSCETNARDVLLEVMTPDDLPLVSWAVVGPHTENWLERGAPRQEVPMAAVPSAKSPRGRR